MTGTRQARYSTFRKVNMYQLSLPFGALQRKDLIPAARASSSSAYR